MTKSEAKAVAICMQHKALGNQDAALRGLFGLLRAARTQRSAADLRSAIDSIDATALDRAPNLVWEG